MCLMILTTPAVYDLLHYSCYRRPHYASHPIRPSVCPSVRPSVLCPSPLARKRKTTQRSNFEETLPTSGVTGRAILRSQSKVKVTGSGNVKIGFCAYLCFCIYSRKTNNMTVLHAAQFAWYNAASKLYVILGRLRRCSVSCKRHSDTAVSQWNTLGRPQIVSLFCDTQPLVYCAM